MEPSVIGEALRKLRTERNVGLRELSRIARISPAAISAIESGQSSPTMATLHRVLGALGSDFVSFFATQPQNPHPGPVFHSADMVTGTISGKRLGTMLFPRSAGVKFAMSKGIIPPHEDNVEWEIHDFDIGGLVLSGGPMLLEIEGQGQWEVAPGDAFYINAGQKHRGQNLGQKTIQLVCGYSTPHI